MKIAIVIKDYDQSRGGAERYLVGILPYLLKGGVSVDLIVNRSKGSLPPGCGLRKVKAMRWSGILAPLSFNWSVQRLLKEENYDLVYGLTQIYPQDVYRAGGGLVHSWFKIKYPGLGQRLFNYFLPRNLVRFYLENKIFNRKNYKMIITNSYLCKNQILRHYPVSPEKVEVVYNGVDSKTFNTEVKKTFRQKVRNELGIPQKAKMVLFLSNNWARKGLKELIQAIAHLKDNEVWLLVAGRGKPGYYLRLANKLDIIQRIKFAGSTAQPEQYYGTADIFVLPTYYDPFANVCLEALSCGLPVLTTYANGAAECIQPGSNGYLVEEPTDRRELARKIKETFVLAGSSVEKSIKDFTITSNVQKTLAVLKKSSTCCPVSKEELLINNEYRDILAELGWLDADSILRHSQGILFKKNKLRSVIKIEFKEQAFFLKRHFQSRSRCHKITSSWAWKEWQNIFRLKALGIATMKPVAVGSKRGQSFIITESLAPARRLEDFIKEAAISELEKKEIIYQLALIARKLHQNNLFHKDFYTGHIFIERIENMSSRGLSLSFRPRALARGKLQPESSPEKLLSRVVSYQLYLIDLQRLAEHITLRNHRRIKDLASLDFTSKEGIINNRDKIRFLRYYLKVNNLSQHKKFVQKILKKSKRISQHTAKRLIKNGIFNL